MIKDTIDYESTIKTINEIFVEADEDISKSILDNYKIKTRKTKLSFKDALIYSLNYTQNNKTKIDIINKFNKDIDDYEKKYPELHFMKKLQIYLYLIIYQFIINSFLFIKISLLIKVKHLLFLLMEHIIILIY